MLKKLVWLPAFLLLLVFGQNAMACGTSEQGKGKAQCHCKTMHNMATQLNLSTTQQAKLKAIRLKSRSTIVAKHEEMKKIRSQMLALTAKDKVDQAKLDALINQQKELFASIVKLRMMYKNQVYNTLDAAQKIKFTSMIDKWTDEGQDIKSNPVSKTNR